MGLIFEAAHWGHFLNLVGDDLRKRGLRPRVDGDEGVVRLADGRNLGLENLAQLCHHERWDRWPGVIDHHFGVALRATATAANEELADFDTARPLCKLRLWPKNSLPCPDPVIWDIADDLVAALTLDLPEMLMTIDSVTVKKWPISKADLWKLALANVRADGLLNAGIVDVPGDAVVKMLEGDRTFFAASHLLFLEDYLDAPAPHGCVVAVPTRHSMVFHRIVDLRIVPFIQSALKIVPWLCHQGPGSISASLYWWRANQPLMLLPTQVVGNTLEFYPPAPFVQMLNGLPPRA